MQIEDMHLYLLIGGGIVIALAIICYFLPVKYLKLPALLSCTLGGIAAGLGAGILVLYFFGYHWKQQEVAPEAAQNAGGQGGAGRGDRGGMMARGGMGGGGAGGGARGAGGGGRGGRGGGAPSTKIQLAALITKLDQLTHKELVIVLSPEQKKALGEQLKGLTDKDSMTDDEAKPRLDALLKALEKDKNTLVAAGFRWPGEGGGRGGRGGADASGGRGARSGGDASAGRSERSGADNSGGRRSGQVDGGMGGPNQGGGPTAEVDTSNPFKKGDDNKHLKSLEADLEKTK